MRNPFVVAILWAGVLEVMFAQAPPKVDFARDVQPLFRQYCIGCHGPSQQMNGLRLDERASVLKMGARRLVRGGSENSLIYLRLIGNDYGLQMPPTGPLGADQVGIIKAWIDQGADWPDELAGDAPAPLSAPDAGAALAMAALRDGDRQEVKRIVTRNPKVIALRGPGGATPLMFATLYGKADDVRFLLGRGADPNAKNDAGATALMWALDDVEKTRLLLEHGANPNALSEAGRTPLAIAAGRNGSSAVVRLLLEHGASLLPPSGDPFGMPLPAAAYAADDAVVRMLIDHGAELKTSAPLPWCLRCDHDVANASRHSSARSTGQLSTFRSSRSVPLGMRRTCRCCSSAART